MNRVRFKSEIKTIITKYTKTALDDSMRFEELEIDSLVYVQMIVELEELFHCEFPDKFLLLLENEKTIEEFIKEIDDFLVTHQEKAYIKSRKLIS